MSWAERIARITGSCIVATRRLAGGDLGGATRLDLADGRSIVAKQGPNAATEGEMLAALGRAGAPVPRLVHCEEELLLMEFVADAAAPDEAAWLDLAAVIERLHQPTDEPYGWPADYAFGPLAIVNREERSWTRFWAEHRLLVHAPHVGAVLARRLETLAARLGELIPAEPPSALLHGDLWRGNILFAPGRVAALIDPASYRGDREVDIAMLSLFDRPPEAFFAALSLDAGWRERLPVYRLWPLLVHLRLFGAGYRSAVERALEACGV